MPKGKPESGQRRTAAQRYADVPELVAAMKDLTKSVQEIYAQNRALFTKLHNCMIDIEASRTMNRNLLAILAEILEEQAGGKDSPSAAVIKDFLRNKGGAQIVRTPNDSRG